MAKKKKDINKKIREIEKERDSYMLFVVLTSPLFFIGVPIIILILVCIKETELLELNRIKYDLRGKY